MHRGPGWSAVILISLVTSLATVFGARWATEHGLLPAAEQSSAKPPVVTASVPMLEGMAVGAATELLQARGLTVLVREKQQHATLAPDNVISQDPLPGSVLPLQAPVSVTVSSGKPPEVRVPELAGLSFDDALRALETAGLKLGAVSGPQDGERRVERSDAPSGTLLAPGSTVALTFVATGVAVPKLIGLPWPRAKRLVEESGFKVGKMRDRYDKFRDAWIVLEQTPGPGSQVAAGSSIDIVRASED